MDTDSPWALDAAPFIPVEQPAGRPRLQREGVMTTLTDGLSAVQVCEFAGISYRQVDYWTRTGILVATTPSGRPYDRSGGSGTARRYRPVEARIAWMIRQAQSAGRIDLGLFRPCAESMRETGAWGGMLVLGASDVGRAEHAADLLDLIRALGPSVTIVNLDDCPPIGGAR